MTLADRVSIAEIVSAIAVAVTLVDLAVQTKHSDALCEPGAGESLEACERALRPDAKEDS